MVHLPTRGDGPLRFGPDVPMVPDIGPGTVDASVYTDPERYERERETVLRRSWQVVCRSSELAGPRRLRDVGGPRRDDRRVAAARRRRRGVPQRLPAPRRADREGDGRLHAPVHLPLAQLGLRPRGRGRRRPGPRGLRRGRAHRAAAPAVEVDEWGGWVWAVLAGPGVAPPLREWLGSDITADLGAYRMQDMVLVEKLVWDVPVNWKVIVDAFNENYHAAHLHSKNTKPQDVRDGRFSTYFVLGRHGMMVIPYKGVLPRLTETLDHQSLAICHYTLFPTAVFNCNPHHIQLFRSVPLTADTSRFECWELQYPDGGDGVRRRP